MNGQTAERGVSRAARRAPAGPHAWAAQRIAVFARSLVMTLGLCGACATTSRSPASAAADTEKTMLDLRARNAGYVRRIEELENQIFILEDRLDSDRLARERRATPRLPAEANAPSVSHPGSASAASSSVGSPAADEGGAVMEGSLISEEAVDFAGDAAMPGSADASLGGVRSGARPMLRLGRAPEPPPVRAAEVAMAPPSLAGPPAALELYRRSLEALRDGRHAEALAGFRRFVDVNPRHDYADNAQYWIGECFYDQHDFRAAAREFRRVVERYPRGNKVPDAMLKLGFALLASGSDAGGRAVLESLARAFPKDPAARLASERLAHPEPEPAAGADATKASRTFGTIAPAAAAGTSPAAPLAGARAGRVRP